MKPMKNYEQRMRRVLKKFKSMVKKHGFLGVLLLLGGLSWNCGIQPPVPLYGPIPAQECYTNEDCVAKHGSNWYCDLNEMSPTCKCEPVMLYGPQGCTSDADCQTQSGANWYCDLTNAYDDGCGGTVSWPACKQKPCMPKLLYGPPPCGSDEECQTQYGADWYCDQNAFDNGCGGTWPACKQKPCMPRLLYGPQPCESDEQCQSQNGANWYCDKTNAYDDGCGGIATWPICKLGAVPLYGPLPVQL